MKGGEKLNLDEKHFTYDGFDSREFSIIFAHVETSEYLSMIGSTETSTVFTRRNNRRYFIGDRYESSPVEIEVEMVMDDDGYMPLNSRRKFEQAMFYKQEYKKLFIDLDDDVFGESYEFINGVQRRFYLNCRFVNMSRIEDGIGRTVGYRCTMECDTCMYHQEPVIETFSQPTQIIINVDTDYSEYTYPKLTVDMSSGGSLSIVNESDDEERITGFSGLASGEFVIDSRTNMISGNNYSKFTNKNFVRLINGENILSIDGNVESITVEYENYRYL